MPPKQQRCAATRCPTLLRDGSFVSVRELPELVRQHVMHRLECDEERDLCFECVRGCAFDWGFPRGGRSAIRLHRGLCAADNFACDFDGRSKLLPLPTVFEGVPVDVEKLAAAFGVPQYSPSLCVCRGHRNLMTKYLGEDKSKSVLSPPAAKRARASEAPADPLCQCTVCVNVRAALPHLQIGDRHKVLLVCSGSRDERISAEVARCLGVHREQIQRRVSLRTLWLSTGYDHWRRQRRAMRSASGSPSTFDLFL
jgi:hypothetical protein